MSPITADQLLDLLCPQHLRISPSGKHVVFEASSIANVGEHKVSQLWIADVGRQHSARPLTSGLFCDSHPEWSSDGTCIAFISDRAAVGEQWAVYGISLTGGEAYPLTPTHHEQSIASLQWSPNGQWIAYISADEKSDEKRRQKREKDDPIVYGEWEFHRLRLLHVPTRTTSVLFSQDAHVTQLTWKPDSSEIGFLAVQSTEIDEAQRETTIYRTTLDQSRPAKICTFPGNVADLCWFGDEFLFVAAVTPGEITSAKSVYKMNQEGQWSHWLFGIDDNVTDIRSTGDLSIVRVEHVLAYKFYVLANPFPKDSSPIFKLDEQVDTWDARKVDGEVVLALAKSSPSVPSEAFSMQHGQLTELSQLGHKVAQQKICSGEAFFYTADDGTNLDGVVYYPSNAEKKPLSTVVFVHGGPTWRLNPAFHNYYGFYWGPWLASAGYVVLCPNYRGGLGHGERFTQVSKGGMGTVDHDDVISMVKAGVQRGIVEESKVAITGWSQGGFLSYLAITRNTFPFKAAVCGAGVSDWDMLVMSSDVPMLEAQMSGEPPWVAGPQSTKARHGSAIWNARHVKTPLLILHGENDVRVPLSQGAAFHRACLHYGIPCEFVIYPREGHIIMERNHLMDLLNRMRRFLDTHLH